MEKKFSYETSRMSDLVKGEKIYPRELNPSDWLYLVRECLKSAKPLLRQVAEEDSDSRLFSDLLNHHLDGGGYHEKRVTSPKVIETIQKALITNDRWLFIPVKVLEKSEEKGLFFEKRLFILADLGCLVIMNTSFRKIPHDPSSEKISSAIDEVVVECTVVVDDNGLGLGSQKDFPETMIPFFADPKLNLGEHIINHSLDDIQMALWEREDAVKKDRKTMETLLKIRRNLGFANQVDFNF